MTCSSIFAELARLRNHVGFPALGSIGCPVFQQDKFRYISSLPRDRIIPTEKILLPLSNEGEISFAEREALFKFLELTTEGSGYVVKAPFSTNGEGVSFCRSKEEVLHTIYIMAGKFDGRAFGYLMVQPCLKNKRECKVVCLNGMPKYISKHSRSSKGTSFKGILREDIMAFAQDMLFYFRSHVEESIVNMLCRVDVMMYNGRLVVNELESFEAQFTGPRNVEAQVIPFLVDFWKHQIMLAANEVLC
jgi:hypothetical protein